MLNSLLWEFRRVEASDLRRGRGYLFICCRIFTKGDVELLLAALRLLTGYANREVFGGSRVV